MVYERPQSEANVVAEKSGIDAKILRRSQEILRCLSYGENLRLDNGNLDLEKLSILGDDFLKIPELNCENLAVILEQISGVITASSNR